jgi:hypothetical protein
VQEHPPLREQEIGVITHYWPHIGVAGVHLEAPVGVGDHIHVVGHTDDFEQDVDSLEIEHRKVPRAEAGADVGIRLSAPAHEHDHVYRAVDPATIGEGESGL